MLFNNMLEMFKKVSNEAMRIMKYGLNFSFAICIISTLILFTYLTFYHSSFLYLLGITGFRLGIILAVEFIICGLAVDSIKNHGV